MGHIFFHYSRRCKNDGTVKWVINITREKRLFQAEFPPCKWNTFVDWMDICYYRMVWKLR